MPARCTCLATLLVPEQSLGVFTLMTPAHGWIQWLTARCLGTGSLQKVSRDRLPAEGPKSNYFAKP
jgi:hypothetical protein